MPKTKFKSVAQKSKDSAKRMRTLRAEEPETSAAVRRVVDKDHKKIKRGEETPDQSSARRESDRLDKAKRRSQQPEDVAETRRASHRQHMEELRSQESEEITAARRASNRQNMEQHRSQESEEVTAARRASNRQNMEHQRSQESEDVAETRRASHRQHMEHIRSQESEEVTAARRASNRQNMEQHRSQESEEVTAARRASNRQNMEHQRSQESEDVAETRRASHRQHMEHIRSQESEEVTATRRASNRQNMEQHRSQESEEVTAARRVSNRQNMEEHRLQESEEVASTRRLSNRQTMKKSRAEDTSVAQARRSSDRIRKMQQRRAEEENPHVSEQRREEERARSKRRRQSKQAADTTEDCAAIFRSKLAEGPIYSCSSCCRLHYRSGVLEVKLAKYKSEEIHYILSSNNSTQTHDKSWVCKTCHLSLKQNKVPTQSWANGLDLDDIPPQLDLRPLELRLISQRIPFMKLVGLPKGGQKSIHGSAVNVPTKLHSVVSLLPRFPDTAEVVPLKLKRKLSYKGYYMYEYVRPQKVLAALHWLKQNNPLYKDITICSQWEKEWEDNEPDLWEAISKQCQEIEAQDSTNAQGNLLPVSVSSVRVPTTPNGDHYAILRHLAKQRDLNIQDVPGDGNCFFHAVSFSLIHDGLPSVTAVDLRSQLIDFFDTPESEAYYSSFVERLHAQSSSQSGDSSSGRQRREFKHYIVGLRNGEWADNLAVQGVADMLNINIEVVNTITPDWTHDIHPRYQRSATTITIGLMGEQHYVAFTNVVDDDVRVVADSVTNTQDEVTVALDPKRNTQEEVGAVDDLDRRTQGGVRVEADPDRNTHEQEDEEDRAAADEASKLRGIPFDTLLQEEQLAEDNTYSVAPAENQRPTAFLSDDKFEELSNPSKYPYGRGGLSTQRSRKITPRKYFNQRLLHVDGRFAKDIDYLLAAQYAVEAKQVSDSIHISLRQTRGQTFQNSRINAELLKNPNNVQAMLRTDAAFRFMKTIRGSPAYWNTVLLDLLAMVRQLGTPTWFLTLSAADMQWPEVIQSIAHQYGKHLSADDVKTMPWIEKCRWLRSNPVTAARQFQHRLDIFFKDFIGGKANPIGQLQDFMIRIEFQARGSPHAHTILWIKDAPKLDVDPDESVVRFIDQYQTCAIPSEEDCDLRTLVLSVQKHIHSATCRRGGTCRFRFPHLPSMETLIAKPPPDLQAADLALQVKQQVCGKVYTVLEDKELADDISLPELLQKAGVHPMIYQNAMKLMKSGSSVVLKRQPSERWINQYNPSILRTWRANMDLQFITDAYSCIMYITSYMLKSERSMSELLKKVSQDNKDEELKSRLRKLGSAFLNNREVSAQEAVYRLLSLPLKRASRKVVFVNTAPKDKRVRLLKPQNLLQNMADDDENIFYTSPLERYTSRPHELDDMSLAEFAATFTTSSADTPDEAVDHIPLVLNEEDDDGAIEDQREPDIANPSVITLLDGLGHMQRRRRLSIIRFHKEKNEGEEKYRNLLMLYFPWRDESVDLKANFNSYEEHFEHVRITVRRNEAMFSINADAIDQAFDDLQEFGPPEAGWDVVAPNAEFQQAEQEAEGVVRERELPDNDQDDNIDLGRNVEQTNHSELHSRFSAELNRTLMDPKQYRSMMRSLNAKQMDIILYHRKWCKNAIFALKHDQAMPQYRIFLSGPGGVGKSHIIKLIHYETMKLLKPLSGHFEPDELPVLLTAFTGTAAFGIEGMTLHSALGFSCGPRSKKEYQPVNSEKLNTLRSRLGKLKLLIIDEVSMVGADLLFHIHRRLQDICDNSNAESRFGGVSIMAVGDLFQLQPVGQNHVFALPSDPYARLHGSLWEENFHMIELTESMRQRDDKDFAELLMRVRTASCTEQDISVLKSRVISKTDPQYPPEALHVFKTNKEVDEHNEAHLEKLDAQVFVIKATDNAKDVQTGLVDVVISTKPSDTGGLREVLSVGVGARVMVTVNIDVADGLANGVCGTVVGIDNTGQDVHTIFVNFDSERVGRRAIANSQYRVRYADAVPISKQVVQFYTGRGRRSVEAKRTQFPLSLAWGCTIHKVQGKTLHKVVVSMEGNRSFMPGQAYVAFSRVKNINDLYLLGFNAAAIRVNTLVVNEMHRLRQTVRPHIGETSLSDVCRSLNIRLLNIRSYQEHFEDLKADTSVSDIDVDCFVETFLKPQHQIEPTEPSVQIFRRDRPSSVGRGGGVMIVARDNVLPKQLALSETDLECIAVTVSKLSTSVVVLLLYRPPSLNSSDFISKLNGLLRTLDLDVMTVILGDFNVDLIDTPNHVILDVMETFGFAQQVTSPTTDYGSLLDHVYVNRSDITKIVVYDTYFSDHDSVSVSVHLK